MLFAKWWEQPLYADYLRITLGVEMLAAAARKLLAGIYAFLLALLGNSKLNNL